MLCSSPFFELQTTVAQVQSIIPNKTLGVVNPAATAPLVSIPLGTSMEVMKWQGTLPQLSSSASGFSSSQFLTIPPVLSPASDYEREAWRIPLHDKMFSLGRTLQADWGISLQMLRGNCQAQVTMVVEQGYYLMGSYQLLSVQWNTASRLISVPLAFSEDPITHSFGLTLLNTADGLRLNCIQYGVATANNSAVSELTSNLVLRCRLIGLDTEDIPTPRGWIAWQVVPSTNPVNTDAASSALAVIK